MLKKIVIANRGEIACRIIKTAKLMGIRTVAVFSDADKNAQHVQLADEAFHIGPSEAKNSYLNITKIIDTAQKSGADSIHPGYGFLSENPKFVEATERAGLIFIGPSADAIKKMGLKDAAKKLMEEAGVPVVPGYHGSEQSPDFLAQQASKIGYPVILKARSGGGGKGMRIVTQPEEFFTALESAKREAESSFGDDNMLIEKFITSPRHIEVQIFGDNYGNVVHLFERDCSLQRRHQKVIEEAPAPHMTEDVRKAMTDAAIKAAQAIDYSGAGTIEFIVDGSSDLSADGFWFMEMNTRLQVEHPVTEIITKTDLVAWQILVASNQPLPKSQDEIHIHGHAIESRLYAENVSLGFIPDTGKIYHLNFGNARIDSGVATGDFISPWYDPMIAKLITHGPDRNSALDSMKLALRETHIAGLHTNRDFLLSLCAHENFSLCDFDTEFIEQNLTDLLADNRSHKEEALLLGIISTLDMPDHFVGWRQWGAAEVRYSVQHEGASLECVVNIKSASEFEMSCMERIVSISNISREDKIISGTIEKEKVNAEIVSYFEENRSQNISVLFNGHIYAFTLANPLSQEISKSNHENVVLSPMTGIVRSVMVKDGDRVNEGDALIVVEAMKMEHRIKADQDRTIEKVHSKLDDQVESGQILISFKQTDDDIKSE